MKTREAFSTLLGAIEAALQGSLSRSNAATQRGDFDAVEVELERQRNLVSARNQLQGLQELWPRLVGERPEKKPRRRRQRTSMHQRLPRGVKTPQEAFVVPILTALEEMGGSGRMMKVLDQVGEMMSATLNKFDLAPLKNGGMRWRNTAQWARQRMKEEGLLANDSPRGIWEITESGRAVLRQHKGGTR